MRKLRHVDVTLLFRVMNPAEIGTKLLALKKPNSAASCTGHVPDKGTHRRGVRDEIPGYILLTSP